MYGKEREPICFVCASIFDKKLLERGRHSFVPPVKFKCAGRDCEKELTFRQLVDGQCCPETAFVLSLGTQSMNSSLIPSQRKLCTREHLIPMLEESSRKKKFIGRDPSLVAQKKPWKKQYRLTKSPNYICPTHLPRPQKKSIKAKSLPLSTLLAH